MKDKPDTPEKSVGQKIRQFRKRAGISQFELENTIGLSPGHLSRIENGQIEPTKETIIDIAYALRLNTREIASLFGIEIPDYKHLFEEITKILSALNLQEVLYRIVNELVLKMGYIASVIGLVQGDRICFGAITISNISKKILGLLDKPLAHLSLSLTKDSSNLMVKAIKENRVYLTHYTHEYIVPAISKEVADKMQELTGDKSNIIYPLYVEDEPLGAIVYIKKVFSDFRDERETLEIISKQIAVAIRNAIKFEALAKSLSQLKNSHHSL